MDLLPLSQLNPSEIAACLAAVEARDPLMIHVDPDEVLRHDGLAAVERDVEGVSTVLGVGWRAPMGDHTALEVRVPPGHRRKGVGSALLNALVQPGRPQVVGFDAARPRVARFLEHRGFAQAELVFHLRWDGEAADLPPGFLSARIEPESDLEAAWPLIEAVSPDHPTFLMPELSPEDEGIEALSAWWGSQRVGLVIFRRTLLPDPVLTIEGIGVLPGFRARGVGRGLITRLMRLAADEGRGVTLAISHESEDALRWANTLGFWVYRTRAWFTWSGDPEGPATDAAGQG